MVNNNEINYFFPGPNQEKYQTVSAEMTKHLQRDFKDVCKGIECLDGTFSLQVKTDSKPYQASPR